MINIQPITALRDTDKIEKDLKKKKSPIFITKNGYPSFVILSPEDYDSLSAPYVQPDLRPFAARVGETNLAPAEQSDPFGFVRVMAASLKVKVGNVFANIEAIKETILRAERLGAKVLVLPELCLCGYTCGDLFLDQGLQKNAEDGIVELAKWSKGHKIFVSFGAPLARNGVLYNCAINIFDGKILGVTPKTNIPNYSEFYEARYFASAPKGNGYIEIGGASVPFGAKIIYIDRNYVKLRIAVELCEDVWVPDTPSTEASIAGADLILNLSASDEIVGKAEDRRSLIKVTSDRLTAAYAYADAGQGESTTDLVFAGHNIIAEKGNILDETPLFAMKDAIADIDVEKILSARRKKSTYPDENFGYEGIYFDMPLEKPTELKRKYKTNPFIPSGEGIDFDRVNSIMTMQAVGLATRLEAIGCKKVLVGLSGGLDSTLALLVSYEAFKRLGYDTKGIIAITMPSFGTSKRTHDNASTLAKNLKVQFREINIKNTLVSHFDDIKHSIEDRNLTYENAQARERTQVLMDLCTDENAIMVGTGDLSEMCLGWTTYNGDHMAMYGVNASIPKTLVRYLVKGYAKSHPECHDVLMDIIDTPISPELLPTDKKGQIVQMTEDKVGPYELNDFFIYHFLKFGYRPAKLYAIAKAAYKGTYDDATIKKWLRAFYLRFFNNQFKRSCMPDGAKVGSVSISPRGDWRMPSDASSADYLKEIDTL